jgi:hypothetical protein
MKRLICRIFGHRWIALWTTKDSEAYPKGLGCVRCGRKVVIDCRANPGL